MTEKQLYKKVKLLTIAAVLIVFILLVSILVQSIKLSNLKNANAKLEKQLKVLSGQTETIEQEIEYRNSRTYIEQYAREKLGLGYGNEQKYEAE